MLNKKKSAILFVHGGPGLSSSCFHGWFKQLEKTYDLIFYDQNYNVPNETSIIESLCKELRNQIYAAAQKYEEIVIFAHSWGVFLLLKSMQEIKKQPHCKKIIKYILSNPSDTNWNYFCESGDQLFAKMPKEIIKKISECHDGVELMGMAIPYYVGNSDNVPDIKKAKAKGISWLSSGRMWCFHCQGPTFHPWLGK